MGMGRRTHIDMDYLVSDDERFDEPTPEPVFGCQGCGQEFHIQDGVVLERHPEAPMRCWPCAHG
ncbi:MULTISPECIES: hypothetical protein [unclassified Methylobacterium]|uniref:hypothetical protein n=1 Tax=unclassified Methylobacterium TaxID=2615210 RepID=UPI0011C20CBE|nr:MULTISPECIES: hypothetical protein [unclassified Methylobacterium]QEE39910.1 hypothetical protein FVA80_14050 [Methylobacterium sp. WL1]TXN51612.1 hypothetical protein FV241_30055 [Methylobacterium sp. WL2]